MTAAAAPVCHPETNTARATVARVLRSMAHRDGLAELQKNGQALGLGAEMLRACWRVHRHGWTFTLPASVSAPAQRAYARWANAAESLATCGQKLELYECAACHKAHAFDRHCTLRYCPDCVSRVRARTKARVRALVDQFQHRPRFLTLTHRNVADLVGSTTRLKQAFARLRRLKKVMRGSASGRWIDGADAFPAGLYAVEITENLARRDGLVWHPHMHHLVDSPVFLPWNWIVEAWQRANGCRCRRHRERTTPVLCKHTRFTPQDGGTWWTRFDSWAEHAVCLAQGRPSELWRVQKRNCCKGSGVEPTAVDIRAAGEHAVAELAKYVGKSLKTTTGMMALDSALEEFLRETWGRRMVSAYGRLYGLKADDDTEPRRCDCGGDLVFLRTEWAHDYQARSPPG